MFSAIRFAFDEISSFLAAFQFAMGACCVLATILALLAVRQCNKSDRAVVACGIGFSLWTFLEGGYTVNQFDSSTALTAALRSSSFRVHALTGRLFLWGWEVRSSSGQC